MELGSSWRVGAAGIEEIGAVRKVTLLMGSTLHLGNLPAYSGSEWNAYMYLASQFHPSAFGGHQEWQEGTDCKRRGKRSGVAWLSLFALRPRKSMDASGLRTLAEFEAGLRSMMRPPVKQ